jgi:peroxiredoxin Q/BCP
MRLSVVRPVVRRSVRRWRPIVVGALVVGAAAARPAAAQRADSSTAPPAIAVGRPAPDFALPGATRYGLLRDPVRLSDYRGETVVLAFFFKARTKG